MTSKKNGLKYAVKAIPKKPRSRACTPGYLLKLQNEVDCMRQLGASLNAVFLHDVFEDHTHLYMVMGTSIRLFVYSPLPPPPQDQHSLNLDQFDKIHFHSHYRAV